MRRGQPGRGSKRATVPADENNRILFEGNHLESHFVLDCSGRAGLLGRAWREKRSRTATVALCGIWRNEANWDLPNPSHTLVESYENGWAWSVPVETDGSLRRVHDGPATPIFGRIGKDPRFPGDLLARHAAAADVGTRCRRCTAVSGSPVRGS